MVLFNISIFGYTENTDAILVANDRQDLIDDI